MTQQFERLASPVSVGGLRLKHRMIMGPMGDRMWSMSGAPGPGVIDYYTERVRGGASMITIGASDFHPDYESGHRASLSHDVNIPALRTVTEAIHAAGAPVLIQMHHGGPYAVPSVSPSAVPSLSTSKSGFVASRALSLSEVEDIRDRYIAGAARAQMAGFDGIEMAGQANYLLGQFFSPRTNLRTDRYGGSADNRMRFALEILQGIRERCGAGFVVGYAISADEFKPGGVVLEMCIPFAVKMERLGLDYIDIRVGTHESFATSKRATAHNRFQSRSGIWDYSVKFKAALQIPVFCSSHGCYDPDRWERALADGEADVIQLGKPLLADAALPNKVLAGRLDDIRPCVLCMQCLDPSRSSESEGARTYCAVSPRTGAEWRMPLTRAENSRKVLVVGGGPAGLQAALAATERGHHVTLMERRQELGGALRAVGLCEGGDVYLQLRDWMRRACLEAGVSIRLGVEATAEEIIGTASDVVILATGAAPVPLAIKGIEKVHVRTLDDVLSGLEMSAGNVVVVGGDQEGVLVAGAIAASKKAKTVTIVESRRVPQLGEGLAALERTYAAMTYLPGHGIEAVTGVRIEEIRDRDVLLVDQQDGKRQKLKAEMVVVAVPGRPDPSLQRQLLNADIRVQVVGDALGTRSIADAIHGGESVGREI